MNRYRNLGGNSNVSGYETGPDSITVWFNDGGCYIFNNQSAGHSNIQQMKSLASRGQGLNGFINANVKFIYFKKLR